MDISVSWEQLLVLIFVYQNSVQFCHVYMRETLKVDQFSDRICILRLQHAFTRYKIYILGLV